MKAQSGETLAARFRGDGVKCQVFRFVLELFISSRCWVDAIKTNKMYLCIHFTVVKAQCVEPEQPPHRHFYVILLHFPFS